MYSHLQLTWLKWQQHKFKCYPQHEHACYADISNLAQSRNGSVSIQIRNKLVNLRVQTRQIDEILLNSYTIEMNGNLSVSWNQYTSQCIYFVGNLFMDMAHSGCTTFTTLFLFGLGHLFLSLSLSENSACNSS